VRVILLAMSLFLLAQGCSSSSAAICQKGDECNLLPAQSNEECVAKVNDGLDDGRLEPAEVSDCASCVDDPENSCGEVLSDCLEVCGSVFAEIVLGDAD